MSAKRRLTSVDVARASGVSRATVSYVLNNNPRQTIPEETRQRVLKAVRKLGYRPSAAARVLRAGYSQLVLGVLQLEQVDPDMARNLHYLETELAARDFTLVWLMAPHTATDWHPSANLTPAALLIFVDETDPKVAEFLRRFDVPVLSILSPTILQSVGRAQVSYLSERGKRQIIYAAPERKDVQLLSQGRLDGCRQECSQRALRPPFVQVVPADRSAARKAVAGLLARRAPPFGICCYNDEVAFAVLAALSDEGVSVPESVAVIGCDDIPLAQFGIPPLTTIAFDSRHTLDLLIENIVAATEGRAQQQIPPYVLSVVERASA